MALNSFDEQLEVAGPAHPAAAGSAKATTAAAHAVPAADRDYLTLVGAVFRGLACATKGPAGSVALRAELALASEAMTRLGLQAAAGRESADPLGDASARHWLLVFVSLELAACIAECSESSAPLLDATAAATPSADQVRLHEARWQSVARQAETVGQMVSAFEHHLTASLLASLAHHKNGVSTPSSSPLPPPPLAGLCHWGVRACVGAGQHPWSRSVAPRHPAAGGLCVHRASLPRGAGAGVGVDGAGCQGAEETVRARRTTAGRLTIARVVRSGKSPQLDEVVETVRGASLRPCVLHERCPPQFTKVRGHLRDLVASVQSCTSRLQAAVGNRHARERAVGDCRHRCPRCRRYPQAT